MLIHSGDIRDQSRKLSKIAKNFGRFLALSNFWGQAFQNLYPFYHPCLAARRLKKFREDNATRPEVIDSNKLNFRANFKFSRLKLFGETPAPLGVCASKPL